MFRVDRWKSNQNFKPNVHSRGEPEKQDSKEVWFSGCHSDVGGGYKRADSGLSQIPLIWMLEEAKVQGLLVFDRMADYVTGVKPYSADTKYLYPTPDATAAAHNSLKGFWRALEIIPKSIRFREWPKRKGFLGYYLPRAEPRFIESDASVHPTAYERKKLTDYDPENLPPSP